MRVGIALIPTDPWQETVQLAQKLEYLGYDHLWVYDHLTWRRYRDRPWFAAVPWLTGIASETTRIRIGTLVANPNIRHPLPFAKEMVTVDHISGGRITIGVGAGGTGYDATVFGEERLSPSARAARLAEFLELLGRLLTGSVTTYRGEHYAVEDAIVLPRSTQEPRIPVAVAAGGQRTLGLAARFGDAWITWGDTTLQDLTAAGTQRVVRRQIQLLEQTCAKVGRPTPDLDRLFLVGNTEAKPLVSAEAFMKFARTYADIGFTDLIFHHPRRDDPIWNEDPAVVDEIAAALPALREL